MTQGERVARLQKKADDLVKWFEGRELPVAPFKINKCSTVTNTDRFFKRQTQCLEAYHNNPFSKVYVAAYYDLLELKTYMEGKK